MNDVVVKRRGFHEDGEFWGGRRSGGFPADLKEFASYVAYLNEPASVSMSLWKPCVADKLVIAT